MQTNVMCLLFLKNKEASKKEIQRLYFFFFNSIKTIFLLIKSYGPLFRSSLQNKPQYFTMKFILFQIIFNTIPVACMCVIPIFGYGCIKDLFCFMMVAKFVAI
ncbi:unnamed protein product [Rhizopus stolonifer]